MGPDVITVAGYVVDGNVRCSAYDVRDHAFTLLEQDVADSIVYAR